MSGCPLVDTTDVLSFLAHFLHYLPVHTQPPPPTTTLSTTMMKSIAFLLAFASSASAFSGQVSTTSSGGTTGGTGGERSTATRMLNQSHTWTHLSFVSLFTYSPLSHLTRNKLLARVCESVHIPSPPWRPPPPVHPYPLTTTCFTYLPCPSSLIPFPAHLFSRTHNHSRLHPFPSRRSLTAIPTCRLHT